MTQIVGKKKKKPDSWLKKETKKGVIISVLNFFSPIFPLWFSILNNLLIMYFLIGIRKALFHAFSQCFHFIPPEIIKVSFGFLMFQEYKGGTLGRNRSSFLNHFSPNFLFYTPCKRQKNLRSIIVSRGYRVAEYWGEMGEIISYLC